MQVHGDSVMRGVPCHWQAVARTALLSLALLASACDEPPERPPVVRTPDWAKVSEGQTAEARRRDVPVAFENDLGLRFVYVPSMGERIDAPVDEAASDAPAASATTAVYMQITEVSVRELDRWPKAPRRKPRDSIRGATDLKPASVSFLQAQAYADWLTQRDDGWAYRLPTKQEWSHARRVDCPSDSPPEWFRRRSNLFDACAASHIEGEVMKDHFAWDDGWPQAAPVASFEPGTLGLYDMVGNVSEWCQDVKARPRAGERTGDSGAGPQGMPRLPLRPFEGGLRPVCGPSWADGAPLEWALQSEELMNASASVSMVGFRLVAERRPSGEARVKRDG